MKTRRRIFWGLWILSLVAISFFGGAISYGFFFGMTLIPVISIIYIICVYFGFRIYQQLESRNMVSGQAMPYYFVLQNDALWAMAGISLRMYSSFSYVEDIQDDIEYELLPGDRFRYETKLVCRYRGEYEVGVKEIIVSDFFRLFRARYKVPGAAKAIVLPKIVRMEVLNSISDITSLLQKESQAEKKEPDIIVRDYAAGDSLKQIHWKASAREGKLKTRTMIGEEKQNISIIFDTKRYGKDIIQYLPLENKILETVLALGYFFAEKNMTFSVYYGQEKIQKNSIKGINNFEAFYEETSRVSFDAQYNMEPTLDQVLEQGAIYNSRVVFCILHDLNDTILNMTEQLAEAGIITVLYVITDKDMESYVRRYGNRQKIHIIPVEAEL